MGEFIGKNSDFNKEVLREYIECLDHSKPLITVLRQFLESFVIPGEAPIIQRILEFFAAKFYSSNQHSPNFAFLSEDAVFLVCYATLMLNVDLHSTKVIKKMEEAQFFRQLEGMNEKTNFEREMLSSTYQQVLKQEIKLKEFYYEGNVTKNRWNTLLERSHFLSIVERKPFSLFKSKEVEKEMFLLLWGSLTASLSMVFETTKTKQILQFAMEGFELCATIGSKLSLTGVVDNLVINLSNFSSFLIGEKTCSSYPPYSPHSSHPPHSSSSTSPPPSLLPPSKSPPSFLSPLSPSSRLKTEQALSCLFRIASLHSNFIRDGWTNVCLSLNSFFNSFSQFFVSIISQF